MGTGTAGRASSMAPCTGGHSPSLQIIVERIHTSCVSLGACTSQIISCSMHLESQVSMQRIPPFMYGSCSDNFHFSFSIWPQTTSGRMLTAYYLLDSIWMYLFLFLKKTEKHLFSKISLSSLKAHFNLIVWHSHSQNETLCGKIKTAAIWNGPGPGSILFKDKSVPKHRPSQRGTH